MVRPTVAPCSDAVQVAELLDGPEIAQLVTELEATRWTGRPGFPIRAMVGMALAKHLYTLPTWTRTVALVREHAALRAALGCPDVASVPSVHACCRFAAKLRRFKPLLDACLDRVTAALHEQIPNLGTTVAIDASDMPAYANGQRYLYKGGPERKRYADPDASWGHRSAVSTRAAGSFYGYKLHQVVCATTDLPLAWRVETAKDAESTFAVPLLDAVRARGFRAEVAIMDMGYDLGPVYDGCEERGCHPVIPLRETPAVKAGKHLPPTCEHGAWTFAGSDAKRQAAKWRCPTGECSPASRWIGASRLHTLIPRGTDRWKKLYRQRGAVERENGRLKHEWGLLPLRVRRRERVALHADHLAAAAVGDAEPVQGVVAAHHPVPDSHLPVLHPKALRPEALVAGQDLLAVGVEPVHLVPPRGQHDHVPGGVALGLLPGVPPVVEQGQRQLLLGLGRDHPVVGAVQLDRLVHLALPHELDRLTLPGVQLPAVLDQLRGAEAEPQGAEAAAGVDRRELAVVADQDHLRLGPLGVLKEAGELAAAGHAGLVDHQHRPSVQQRLARGGRIARAGGRAAAPGG